MKCIYCLKDDAEVSFNKTEHVLSQSFGLFKNNFTLNGIVCDSCNKYLGDNLEIVLARGTLEGAWRYDFGIKSPEEYNSIGKRDRVVIKVEEGPFKGSYAYKKYSEEYNGIVIFPVPQIGFLNPHTKEYDFCMLDKIPTKNEIQEKGYDINNPNAMFFPMVHFEEVKKALESKGINLKTGENLIYSGDEKLKWLCLVEETKDDVVLRAIAKIAFNYFAYSLNEKKELSFIFHKDFDVIRRFILYGEKAEYPLHMVSDDPILGDEPVVGKRRSGHLITVNWAGDGISILAQVSLFNWMTYKFCLARAFTGEHKDIRRGSFFNFHSNEIMDLGTASCVK